MKNLMLIMALTTLMCCTKDDNNNLNSQLLGKWKWIESSGGLVGETINPQTTGENRNIEITLDKIKYFTNGILIAEFNYSLEKGESIRTTEETDLMIYENDTKQSIVIIDNKLILYDECNDCYQHEYVRE